MRSPSLPHQNKQNGFSKPLILAVLVVLLGLASAGVANEQRLLDYWRLHGYQAPAAISALATQDTMNAYTRHLFYLNKPQLLPTVTGFRADCPENEDTIVLGCYHPGQNGIFIYNVQDPALAGVQQVTAAHEVLHSVYARLSNHDRQQLDIELQAYYEHGLTDTRVMAEVAIYQKTEPHDVYDEMSCTYGTEIADLPAPLEAYYKRFFTGRAKIVAYEQQYQGQFTLRTNQITADDAQLAIMKAAIDSQQSGLDSQLQQIQSDRDRINGYANSGNSAAYNAAVPGFNSEVSAYDAVITNLQTEITSYNQLVATRNQFADQLATLGKALDTRTIKTMQ